MSVRQFQTTRIFKPWGRTTLWPGFDDPPPGGEPVGEILFTDPGNRAGHALLVKYLFTSERLSIQVHPDDRLAAAHGYRCGKDEAWLILAAGPGARIGLGLRHAASSEELRAAALDGSIVDLVEWRPVAAGDYIYSPAGTVHAIGAGITMIEIQQNIDLTYRLYDYGRPRELHLDEGIGAADPARFASKQQPQALSSGRVRLNDGPRFTAERWSAGGSLAASPSHPVWLVPVSGRAAVGTCDLSPGSCWLVEDRCEIAIDGDVLLAAATNVPFAGSGD